MEKEKTKMFEETKVAKKATKGQQGRFFHNHHISSTCLNMFMMKMDFLVAFSAFAII